VSTDQVLPTFRGEFPATIFSVQKVPCTLEGRGNNSRTALKPEVGDR